MNPTKNLSFESTSTTAGTQRLNFSRSFKFQTSNGVGGGEVLDRVKRKLGVKMDLVFERCLALDTDFPIVDSPVWVFGRSYSIHYGKDLDGKDLDELRRTVGTCLWMTYRKNFPSIGETTLTSDRGWGCMIRAGQMMMAKTLLLRHLGPDWHWESSARNQAYLQILSLFGDTPAAPLSLHQIAESGASLGKPVGSWLGPNTVAQAFKRILSTASTALDLELVISMDSTVIRSEIKRSCLASSSTTPAVNGIHFAAQSSPSCSSSPESVPPSPVFSTPRPDSKWRPLLLIVPLRLGLSDLNPSYVPAFRSVFEVKQNIGMLGGRPNSALYFIGYAEEEVLFLDPHTVQTAGTVGDKIFETEKQTDESYHISKPGRMPFAAMDPSIAVCFYCPSEEDFDSLCTRLGEKWATAPLPLFEICERRPVDWIPLNSVMTSSSSSLTPPRKSSSSRKSYNVSPSQSWTAIGGRSSGGPHRNTSRSEGNSPAATGSSGRSDADDEDFEILG